MKDEEKMLAEHLFIMCHTGKSHRCLVMATGSLNLRARVCVGVRVCCFFSYSPTV